MPGRRALMSMAACIAWAVCGATGCETLNPLIVANDSPVVVPADAGTRAPVDAGTLEDIVRDTLLECRLSLIDAGRLSPPARFDYCSIAWFYEGCPLRVCAEELAKRLEPRCPPRDSGVETSDSELCEALVWPFLPHEI